MQNMICALSPDQNLTIAPLAETRFFVVSHNRQTINVPSKCNVVGNTWCLPQSVQHHEWNGAKSPAG